MIIQVISAVLAAAVTWWLVLRTYRLGFDRGYKVGLDLGLRSVLIDPIKHVVIQPRQFEVKQRNYWGDDWGKLIPREQWADEVKKIDERLRSSGE